MMGLFLNWETHNSSGKVDLSLFSVEISPGIIFCFLSYSNKLNGVNYFSFHEARILDELFLGVYAVFRALLLSVSYRL